MPGKNLARAPWAATLLLPFALAGCSAPAPEPAPEPREVRPVKVDRAVLRALRAYVYASYGLILASERPGSSDPALLRERQELAREELRQSLLDAGADPTKLRDAASLVAAVREGIEAGGRYAILLRGEGEASDSVLVVRIREREVERSARLFGEDFRYRLTSYDELLVADYPTWRAEELRQPVAREVATYRQDGLVQVDRAAAREIGARLFLPQVERLRATAKAATPEAFRARAADLPQLLSLAKAVLRWRSLEPLWSRIATRGRDEQLARFTEDYAALAELRAVAELHALGKIGGPAALGPDGPSEERQRLHELGTLSAAIHGDPLAQVADVMGLAVLSLDGPRHAPHYRAARQLVLDLVAKVRGATPASDAADAAALAELAWAPAERLRELAQDLYSERLAQRRTSLTPGSEAPEGSGPGGGQDAGPPPEGSSPGGSPGPGGGG